MDLFPLVNFWGFEMSESLNTLLTIVGMVIGGALLYAAALSIASYMDSILGE